MQNIVCETFHEDRLRTQQYIDQLVDGGWLMRAGVARVVYLAPTHARAWCAHCLF